MLILATPRARVNGPAFLLGWIFGLTALGGLVLLVAGGADASDDGEPATWVSVLKLVLGALLLVFAVEQWRGRRRGEKADAEVDAVARSASRRSRRPGWRCCSPR